MSVRPSALMNRRSRFCRPHGMGRRIGGRLFRVWWRTSGSWLRAFGLRRGRVASSFGDLSFEFGEALRTHTFPFRIGGVADAPLHKTGVKLQEETPMLAHLLLKVRGVRAPVGPCRGSRRVHRSRP